VTAAGDGTTSASIVAAFVEGDFDGIPALTQRGLDEGADAQVLLDDGLIAGIREVGEMCRRGEAFLPEMMLAAEAWQSGIDILEPHLVSGAAAGTRGRVVIGTVKGDIHSLGKNIVGTMLKASGFDVVDLGVDVPASRFVAVAAEERAQVIAVSALMTTTMPQQREVIEHLEAAGKRQDHSVLVGGASTTGEWAREIGADAYGESAADAVALAGDCCARSGGS